MKKIISMLVAVLMVVAMLPAATMAAGEMEHEHILLSVYNFTHSSATTTENYSNDLLFKNAGERLKIAHNIEKPSAKVYIPKAGTYAVWVLQGAASDATARVPKVTIGEESQAYEYSKAYSWKKKEWNLLAGWNEIKIGTNGDWLPWFFNALYITDDLTFVPDVNTDEALLAYHDTEAPVFEASADVETSFANGVLTVSFPEADDDNDVIYEYTVGGTTSIIENISSPVAVSGLVGTDELILTASDKWGNSTTKTFTVTAPRTKWMLTWNNFVKPDFDSWTYQNSSSLGTKSIQPNTHGDYREASSNAKAKASFYVETAGNYAVWVLSKNGKTSDGRTAKIYVDGVSDQTAYNDSTSFVWGKGTGPANGNGYWNLTKGWHTVEFGLSGQWKPYDLNAIYITSDLTETVTTDNDDDDALLAAYGDSSVKINGELCLADGLEKAGYAVEDSSINITPVKAHATADSATVAIGGSATSWDTVTSITLNKGVNTVTVDSSDDSADCSFKVASTGKVINHRDTEASITGGVEGAIVGVDGVTNTVYLNSASSKATFSAKGIEGKAKVYVYIVAAENKDSSVAEDADVVINDSKGETAKKPDTKRTVGTWTDLGAYNFSGSEDEYVEIKGQDGANVYIDSVKFVYTDDYLVSAPVMVKADGKIKYTYECYKQTDSTAAPVAIVAEYSGTSMNNVSVNELAHTEKGFYTISTNAINEVSGSTYRSFIWASIGNLVPLR